MKLKEKVFKVMEETSFTNKEGKTTIYRDLVLITDEQYPKEIALTFKDGNCQLLNAIQPGDIVEVTFDIRSTMATNGSNRYFTSLNAWKIDIIESVAQKQAASATATAAPSAPVDSAPLII